MEAEGEGFEPPKAVTPCPFSGRVPYQFGQPSGCKFARSMPRVGFEPTRERFLRPPPLPLGHRSTLLTGNALSRVRTCNNVTLNHAPLPGLGYQSVRPTVDAGGS